MNEIDMWKKYKKIQKIGESSFECIYKGKNKEKGNYVIIKEIEKKNSMKVMVYQKKNL